MEWEEIKKEKRVWNYKEQPEIIGVLLGKVAGHFGGQDYVLLVKDLGETTIFAKTVLKSKLDEVAEGTLIQIKYLGAEKSPKGRVYENFSVFRAKTEEKTG